MSNEVLLLGNGINRLSNEYSWSDLLDDLITDIGKSGAISYKEEKPFTLLYEEIYSRALKHLQRKEIAIKKKIADLVLDKFTPNEFHTNFLSLDVEHILTTNYDYNLESAISKTQGTVANVLKETKYNLFRRREVNGTYIWHLHGEADVPNSITLGHEHYAGYLQKMGAYLKDKIVSKRKGESKEVRSPLQRSLYTREAIPTFEETNSIYSWVDLFVMDDVHILGLSLDYTEIELWWLLLYKERLRNEKKFNAGKTVYYSFYPHKMDKRNEAKLSLLESLGIEVVREDVGENYERIADAYSQFIENFPLLEGRA
jgi:hypothetical protein